MEETTTIKANALMMMHKAVVVVVVATAGKTEVVGMGTKDSDEVMVGVPTMMVKAEEVIMVVINLVIIAVGKVAMAARRGMVMSHPVVMAVRMRVDTVVTLEAMVAVVVVAVDSIKYMATLVVAMEELVLLTSIKTRSCGIVRDRATRMKAVYSLKP